MVRLDASPARRPGRPASDAGSSAAVLQIRLFGPARIASTTTPVVAPPPAILQLLAYLLVHRRHHRNVVCDAIWPDITEDRARRRLNTNVWRLRKYLESLVDGPADTIVCARGDELAIDLDHRWWTDVDQFRAAVEGVPATADDPTSIERIEAAVELYRGDLLEGSYDDWLIADRERYRQQYLSCLDRLVRWHHDHGNLDAAVDYGRRILAVDPLRESVHRTLMGVFIDQGDRSAAIRQYRACEAVLARELDAPPMPETEILAARVRALDVTVPAEPTNPVPVPDQLVSSDPTTATDETLRQLRAALASSQATSEALARAIAAIESARR